MIVGNNIYKKFNELEILKGVDLEIREGEIVSIVGSSGAGKNYIAHYFGHS